MASRIIVGISPDKNQTELEQQLNAMGARIIRKPSRELPDVFILEVPSNSDIEGLLHRIRKLHGVRYAELEAWRSTS